MGLGRKNLVYSLILAGIMMLFLVGYFVCMLPSLYVDAMMEQNLKSVRAQHNSYVQNGTYEGVAVKNSAACFSLEFPFAGDRVQITNKTFSAEIVVKDARLYQILERCREKLKDSSDFQDADLRDEISELSDVLKEIMQKNPDLPVEVHLLHQWDGEEFFNESTKIHFYSDTMFILEAGVEDSANRYVNYIVMERGADSMIFTYLPVVAPDMNEICPVVLRSLPMLGAVILLMVLLFSQVYSKGIVNPIVGLVGRAGEMRYAISGSGCAKAGKNEGDEIRELSVTLEDFYLQIRENLRMLEEKNSELAEENRRQEIFLRASSHQLKTPIAAALLLAEGMINEVGRYKDTKMYLPKVKEQLLSMRKIVEDILYMNHCTENMHPQQIELKNLVKEKLQTFQIPIAEKEISVELSGDDNLKICTDEMVFSQILDNLLSNGVKYTSRGGRVRITIRRINQEEERISQEKEGINQEKEGISQKEEEISQKEEGINQEKEGISQKEESLREKEAGQAEGKVSHGEEKAAQKKGRGEIRIENSGVTISEELLPHIFEPFVSGTNDASDMGTYSHGLGLYIASYYAKKLGFVLTVGNGENCVIATLGVNLL